MSTDTPTGAADGPHLDHEASSAALDGEATDVEVAHLAGCEVCQADVARLRVLQSAVAQPVEVDGRAREAAISAALATFEPEVARRPTLPPELLSLRDRRRPASRATAALAPWLGLAAVLLLLVLGVSQLDGLGGGDDDEAATDAAGGEESAEAEGDSESGGGGATSTAPAAPVDVGDLGSLAQDADLRPVVGQALGPVTRSDAVETEAEEGPDETSSAVTEPTALAPEDSASESEDAQAADDDPAAVAAGTCEATAREQLPEAGALLLTGTATIDGAAAAVLGFAAPTERPTVLVALVRTSDCSLITFQSYAVD